MKTAAHVKRLSLSSLLRGIRRRKLYLIVPVILLTPAVAFYTMRLPREYRGKAVVGAEPVMGTRLTFVNQPEAAALSVPEETRAIRETLLSDSVLDTVIHEYHLYPADTPAQLHKALDTIKDHIHIQIEGPDAFDIGFDGKQPDQVMNVTNRLAELFVQRTAELRDTVAGQEDAVLDSEVARLRSRLEKEEDSLRAYKQSGAEQLPERLADNLKEIETLEGQIQSKNDQITEAEAKRSADLTELSAIEKQGSLDVETHEKTPTEIQLDELNRKLAELKARYTPEHPDIIRTAKEIRDLQASAPAPAAPVHHQPSELQMRYIALQADLKSIDPRIASYRQEQGELQAKLQSYQHVIKLAPGYDTQLSARLSDLASARNAYETLQAKQQEARLNHKAQKDAGGIAYKILELAQLPTAPYGPHRSRYILLALVASLGLGFAGIVFAERMDTSFETSEDFQEFSDIPLLSTIPAISARASDSRGAIRASSSALGAVAAPQQFDTNVREHLQSHRVAVLTDPDGLAAQEYGVLSLKIRRWMDQTSSKILVVTSSTGEEGKSLTAVNLSLALASSSSGRVLLVDCDLRLPQVQTRLGLSAEQGLTDYLMSPGDDIAPFITRIGSLDVMTAGTHSGRHTHLLTPANLRKALEKLRVRYDAVVLDSPPVIPIADSHTLSGLADGVLMVMRARRTRPDLFLRALASLEANNLIGVVLNDVQYSATSYEYAYRYYQQRYLGRS